MAGEVKELWGYENESVIAVDGDLFHNGGGKLKLRYQSEVNVGQW